ncbi:hypothetical protein NM208_g3241 [Fusarium decemcellulare]|uniref:Uncharacterized protein n=1 Tax=Fusarium decemcellulare TaxID=57161 RepID=A0ACC1SPM9_9HYPO|nr:hypothetical protein NM208_g3241 [Fusarium decemcellulare]
MAFDHDEFIRLITDYYEFCSRRFWNLPIQQAPPGGWPAITDDIIEKLNKNEAAAKLIRHLPYPEYNMDPEYTSFTPHIMQNTYIADYRCEAFTKAIRNGERRHPINPVATPESVLIATSYGNGGYYVVVDTNEGYVYWSDIQGQHDEPAPELNKVLEKYEGQEEQDWRLVSNVYRPADFFALCKQRFLEMRWIGFGPDEISALTMDRPWGCDEEHNRMVDALKRAGWPGDAEGQGYDLKLAIDLLNESEEEGDSDLEAEG